MGESSLASDAGWRGRWRTITRVGSYAGAIAMVALLIYGLGHSVPDRRAVRALQQGKESLADGHYVSATVHYDAALRMVPDSALARLGLACAFYLRGMRATAALELTKGLEAGAFAERLGHCSHGLDLDHFFFTAKLGLSDAFAAPKVAGAWSFEQALLSEPSGTTGDKPRRLLVGACLAMRAGIPGIAWLYASDAVEAGALDSSDRSSFFACFDQKAREQAGCGPHPSIRACVMTTAADLAYLQASRLANPPTAAGT
jgi:hypothetical protein